MLKKLFSLCLAMLLTFALFAGGKRDVTDRKVENMDSWQESFDINEKKAGKYNIMVTVDDKGGNRTIGGPFNIFIDPESDYPVSGITNPIKGMRVPGNLNIVGTCIDDDAVKEVWLVLDRGRKDAEGNSLEQTVKAEGKEFWSYYLDTTLLDEGPHTIEVYGIDINDLSSAGKANKIDTVTWNLDRRQPVTAVTNYALGQLVSGKINLKGTVYDGNGIKALSYSIDGGETFNETKISFDKKTSLWTFDIPINTKDLNNHKDGPTVVWFKATDKMGSVGVYSYLFFIDNTKPDVVVVSPKTDEVMNGKFGVAGYAYDKVGVKKLSWSYNGKSGDFDLIPGNPYWYVELDSKGLDKKSELIISAEDTIGNKVNVKYPIKLNQEDDKPVIDSKMEGILVEREDGSAFFRGIAGDDDGVATVTYRLDNGPEKTLEAMGVFYAPLTEGTPLAHGKYNVTAYATDINGIKGNPVTLSFTAKGKVPQYGKAKVKNSAGSVDYVPGILVHPESSPVLETSVSSESSIKEVTWKLEWGKEGSVEGKVELKNPQKSVNVSVPISGADKPYGIARLTVSATDAFDRISQQRMIVNLKDLTKTSVETLAVVFDDNRIDENGNILNDVAHPVTGYFVGGNVKTAVLVPTTPFATLETSGNLFTLKATSALGVSAPVKVRVTTDQGLVFESRELIFNSDNAAPVVAMDNDQVTAVDGNETVRVSGKISSEVPLVSLGYRILSAKPVLAKDGTSLITDVTTSVSDIVELPVKNNFTFELPAETFGDGMHVVEVIANNGKEGAGAIKVKKIPEIRVPAGKKVSPRAPIITWLDGIDVYYVITYQGSADNLTGTYLRSEMKPGNNKVSASVKAPGSDKAVVSDYNAKKKGNVKTFIASVNGEKYTSGMEVVVPQSGSAVKLTAEIISDFALTGVSYSFSGEKTFGGDEKQSGKIDPKTIRAIEANRYEIEIPVQNLPVRLTNVAITAETANGSGTYKGTISVVRSKDSSLVNSNRTVYWIPQENVEYNEALTAYVFAAGSPFHGYANIEGPVEAFVTVPGITAAVEGKTIVLTAEKEGVYKNVTVKAKGSNGEYVSPAVNFVVDNERPNVSIVAPTDKLWVQKRTELVVDASDANGIKSVEYSLDGGLTWANANADKTGQYKANLVFEAQEDGLIKVDVRATDNVGKVSYTACSMQKDTVEPSVEVIVPPKEIIKNGQLEESNNVNGETTIVFKLKDAGRLSKAEYVVPKTNEKIPLEMGNMVVTNVGKPGESKLLNDLMVFNFYDEVGNVSAMRKWEFIIDQKSDLPIAEIHLPVEDFVVTRDFEISGVVLDDDGPCKIYYKIDNAEYRLAKEELDTSFCIPVALTSMTDNEHSITVYAEDINGTKGPEFVRNFKVSLEEPKGAVVSPTIEETVKGTIKVSGKASDKNGIKAVYVSIDNGNSYNQALGLFGHDKIDTTWNYEFDTRIVQDGTHVLFIKIEDWYGIEGLYSSLINIDNTNPSIELELPLDDSTTTGMLFFSGQTTDNIGLKTLFITVRSLEGKIVAKQIARKDLEPDEIITQAIDLSSLDNGFYNVELTGTDAADNVTRVSRNIQLNKNKPVAKVDLLYPLNGEYVQGNFNIYGTAISESPIENLELYVDKEKIADAQLSASGYYKFAMSPELISDGKHDVQVQAILKNGTKIVSNTQYLNYKSVGPWVTIDNFTYGDFAMDRPFLIGNAGYVYNEEEVVAAKMKGATKEQKQALADKTIEKVELSLDNGKTFQVVSKNGKWRYRVENEDIAEGYHFLLLRVTMKNGEKAITRTIVQVDKTKPSIKLISPGEGGRYNQQLEFSGLAHDDVALKNVTLTLRKGDKSSYEVPAFIQGLYLDWHFWGATLFDIGAGLTFFDDNVKLQLQWGQFTQTQRNLFSKTSMRYGGDSVFGGKILANVAYFPFRYYFGPDWEWLSANITVGANFTRFSESGAGKAQILSALLTQLEFPRVTFAKQKMFRTIALYTEGQLWFIPSDVSSQQEVKTVVPQISFGLRVNVF